MGKRALSVCVRSPPRPAPPLHSSPLPRVAAAAATADCREVTEGLSAECPVVWDVALNGTRPEAQCAQRLDLVKEAKCDVKNQVWCVVWGCEGVGWGGGVGVGGEV